MIQDLHSPPGSLHWLTKLAKLAHQSSPASPGSSWETDREWETGVELVLRSAPEGGGEVGLTQRTKSNAT